MILRFPTGREWKLYAVLYLAAEIIHGLLLASALESRQAIALGLSAAGVVGLLMILIAHFVRLVLLKDNDDFWSSG